MKQMFGYTLMFSIILKMVFRIDCCYLSLNTVPERTKYKHKTLDTVLVCCQFLECSTEQK